MIVISFIIVKFFNTLFVGEELRYGKNYYFMSI